MAGPGSGNGADDNGPPTSTGRAGQSQDDELGPLGLPLMQDDLGRFFSPSKEWSLAQDDADLGLFEYV